MNRFLKRHLLYIDITQICGIGCAFCMYAEKHKKGGSMELSPQAKENLSALINSPEVKRISISGEGEPLNNIRVFWEILELSTGGNTFEFITSGFFPHDKLATFYDETNTLLLAKGDTCNIRLSSDSYHIEKIKHKPHGFSVQYWRDRQPKALTFSFRSVDIDRMFTRNYLLSELEKTSICGAINQLGLLEDQLVTADGSFFIDYKNLVYPSQSLPDGFLDLQGYVRAIEDKIGRKFTLGSMNKPPIENGMDVTVKPSGDVYFYGIENIHLGNMHLDCFSWSMLANSVAEIPVVNRLYNTPFLNMIENLSGVDAAQTIIREVNNPYWLIKELANRDGLIEQMLSI